MVIRSIFFFLSIIFAIFSLTNEEEKEKVWLDGIHPMLFAESSCVCMLSFSPVAPFVSGKSTMFGTFFEYRKWCGHINILKTFPLVTLILNICVCGSNFNCSSMN